MGCMSAFVSISRVPKVWRHESFVSPLHVHMSLLSVGECVLQGWLNLNSLPPIPDNWSSPGIPLSKPHGPSSGHGNISSTSHHSKLMTDLNLDWHFECHFSWSDELVNCFHNMWSDVYLLKKIFFYTVSIWQIGHYFHQLQLLPFAFFRC